VKVTKKKCEYSSDIFAWFGQLKATQVTFHISVTILSLSHKDMSPLLGRRKLETLSSGLFENDFFNDVGSHT
jgi:hypothetical protein